MTRLLQAQARAGPWGGAAGLLAVISGLLALAGWWLDVHAFTSLRPGWPTMKPNAALAFVLAGASVWLLRHEVPKANGKPGRLGLILALAVACIGALTLAEWLASWNWGLDRLLPRQGRGRLENAPAGPTSLVTALGFALLGSALALLHTKRRPSLAQALLALDGFLFALPLVSLAYGTRTIDARGPYGGVAIHSALLFVLLAAAGLSARSSAGFMRRARGQGIGAHLIRRLLPLAALAILGLGWLRVWGGRLGLYDEASGVAIMVMAMIAAISVLIWGSAGLVSRTEAERDGFFSMSLDMLCIAGMDGHFKRLNPAFSELLGYSQEELQGQPFLAFVHPDDQAATLAEVEKLRQGRLTLQFTNRYRCKDGSWKWLSWKCCPHAAAGLLYATARDVTDLQQAEGELERRAAEIQAANQELEAFSYSVSHDLRAPLRALDGFSQVLLEDHAGRLDAEGRAHLERIRGAAQRMGELIDDLLRLSRIGRAELRRREVDVGALATEVAEELQRREPHRRISLAIERGHLARADARLLRIAFENLLGNAWKFTRTRPEARIAFGALGGSPEPVYFVRDNGAGFDMAYADKLFTPFQRLHSPREFEGTGIGLAIVARVIRRHGGSLRAEGAVGQGATIYFSLGPGGAEAGSEEATA